MDGITVLNIMSYFTNWHPYVDFIYNTIRYANGRLSMKSLRYRFAGEVNETINRAEAKCLNGIINDKRKSIT